jgi:hypothetical protein
MAQLMLHSLHSDFSDYTLFAKDLREKFAGLIQEVDTFYLDSKSISKYYHWHSVIEERLKKLKEFHDENGKKLSRTQRFSQALQGLSQLKEHIPSMPKVGLPSAKPGAKEKDWKEKEDAPEEEKEDKSKKIE